MSLTDLIIIYLACGSPFGVYQVTRDQPARVAVRWASIISSFLLWPAFAVSLVGKRIFPAKDTAVRVEQIRTALENISFSAGRISSLFAFREIFYRYTGLVEAASAGAETRNRFSEISRHRPGALAARCIARRNREKLEFHRARARNEFTDLIAEMASGDLNSREIIELALDLAEQLGDAAAADDLRAIQSGPSVTRKSDLEKEVWKSQTHSASTIN